MIIDLRKYKPLFNIKERVTNFICDKFNIADYPNLHSFIDVYQLDIENVYNDEILYKIKSHLKVFIFSLI